MRFGAFRDSNAGADVVPGQPQLQSQLRSKWPLNPAERNQLGAALVTAVVRDLRSGGYGPGDLRQLQIEGRSALAPITRNTLSSYPHLRRMVRPVVPIAVDWQGHVRLKKHGYRPMKPSPIPLNQAIDWSVSRPLYGLGVRGSHLTLRLPG